MPNLVAECAVLGLKALDFTVTLDWRHGGKLGLCLCSPFTLDAKPLRGVYCCMVLKAVRLARRNLGKITMVNLLGYRWEYSPLAKWGNWLWFHAIDPTLRYVIADDTLDALRRLRGVIQITLVVAILLVPAALIWRSGHLFTASGLLFDIGGVLRVFLLEEMTEALEPFKERENLPSVAMRELIMPEAPIAYDGETADITEFYYKKRGVLFLFLGFILQMVGDLVG